MRRNLKNMIAFAIFSVLVIGSPISILAEEPGQADASGAGQMEASIKPDVYQVILPTDANGIFDFVLDPQKLIEETNAAAYGGKSYEKGATVFFHRSDGQTADEYSSSSDHVTIINRSTVPVDVLIKVDISPESLGGITMTDDREFTYDTGTSLYMALTDGEHTVPIGTEKAYIQATIPAAPEDAFEYSYDQESGEYNYGLRNDLGNVSFPEYSFQLIGTANEKGDWSTVKNVALLVNVTWEVMPGQSLDSDKPKNTVSNETLEGDSIFSQTLETDPVEKEALEDENIQNSTSYLNREPALAERNNLDTDRDLNNSTSMDKEAGADIDSVSGIKETLDENKDSDVNPEFGEGTAPNIAKTSYTLKTGKPLSIDVDLGSGSAAATKIVSVRWKDTDDELLGTEGEADAVRYKEGQLLLGEGWVNECLSDLSMQPAVLVVVFNDVGKTEEDRKSVV